MAVKKKGIKSIFGNQRGIVLPVALALLAIAILFGTTAFVVTRTDIRITGNYKWGEQALYIADAGTEEFRARIKPTAANHINDGAPTSTNWKGLLGDTDINAQQNGYSQGWPSVQTALPYKVEVRHQTDASGTQILRWGDDNADGVPTRNTTTGEIIYVAKSFASTANANKIVEVEVANFPPWSGGGQAVYVEAPTSLQGSSTYISAMGGCDGKGTVDPAICGSRPINRCGDPIVAIQTTQDPSTVTFDKGNPIVEGAPADPNADPPRSIGPAPHDLDIQGMIDAYKGFANFSYHKVSATDTGMGSPPKDLWGQPTLATGTNGKSDPTQASSCSVSNIIYYNTKDSLGQTTDIKLSGGSQGCGMLLVEGDLEIEGGFKWYGIIVVTGSIEYLGGGEKNITGAVYAGGSADADLFGGNANIIFCADTIGGVTNNRPAVRLSWKEIM